VCDSANRDLKATTTLEIEWKPKKNKNDMTNTPLTNHRVFEEIGSNAVLSIANCCCSTKRRVVLFSSEEQEEMCSLYPSRSNQVECGRRGSMVCAALYYVSCCIRSWEGEAGRRRVGQ